MIWPAEHANNFVYLTAVQTSASNSPGKQHLIGGIELLSSHIEQRKRLRLSVAQQEEELLIAKDILGITVSY